MATESLQIKPYFEKFHRIRINDDNDFDRNRARVFKVVLKKLEEQPGNFCVTLEQMKYLAELAYTRVGVRMESKYCKNLSAKSIEEIAEVVLRNILKTRVACVNCLADCEDRDESSDEPIAYLEEQMKIIPKLDIGHYLRPSDGE